LHAFLIVHIVIMVKDLSQFIEQTMYSGVTLRDQ